MLQAITFDFWDTIAIDNSDEAKRRALGLPSKADARAQMFVEYVARKHPHIPPQRAAAAYAHADARFGDEWRNGHHTPAVATRLSYALEYLDLLPGPGHYTHMLSELDELVREIEVMEVRIPPKTAPGVENALYLLSQEYRLGIISDTIHTHGRGLRHLLDQQGLLPFFSVFIFSDEVGVSKPDAAIFRYAAEALDTPPSAIAHVGDRESNDIDGPQAAGFRTVLFTGIVDRGAERTRADAVCRHYADLPTILHRLR